MNEAQTKLKNFICKTIKQDPDCFWKWRLCEDERYSPSLCVDLKGFKSDKSRHGDEPASWWGHFIPQCNSEKAREVLQHIPGIEEYR